MEGHEMCVMLTMNSDRPELLLNHIRVYVGFHTTRLQAGIRSTYVREHYIFWIQLNVTARLGSPVLLTDSVYLHFNFLRLPKA